MRDKMGENKTMKASVIVPVYNQYSALLKTLYAFSMQRCDKKDFEIIVVDDGSTDETSSLTEKKLIQEYGMNIHVIHGENQGRACARNCGVEKATSDYIIFADGDRIPELDFIKKHLAWKDRTDIVIGQSLDYFGNGKYISTPIDWEKVESFSRTPNYLRRIAQIYDSRKETNSSLAWMSFLVGNSSMKKEIWFDTGGFDKTIKKWGFEHFDFSYRAWLKGNKFAYDCEIKSYHIPHPRGKGFYEKAIDESIDMFRVKYPEINGSVIRAILLTNNAVKEYENEIFLPCHNWYIDKVIRDEQNSLN